MGFLSKKSVHATNSIRELDGIAEKMREGGRKITKLNIGDPAAYFPTPKYIIDAYVEALREGRTSYSTSHGIKELTSAVSARYKRMYNLDSSNEDIMVTQGVSEALMFLNSALIDNGDMAITFKPYYPEYLSHLKLNGGDMLFENYEESRGWEIDTDRLERSLAKMRSDGKIKKVKYMILANPNNPTGTVLGRKVLGEIADLASEYGIFLISDEIYDEIIYNGFKFTSMCEVAKGIPHMILNGMSKDYDSTGFRIGFMIIPEDDKKSAEFKRKMMDYSATRLSSNTPAEYAAAEALNNVAAHKRAVGKMVREIEDRANHAVERLAENRYIDVVRPNGAFYILPRIDLKALGFGNDRDFIHTVLEKEGIQLTRGSGFGGPSHIRIVALPPKEILDYAINRLNVFCKKRAGR